MARRGDLISLQVETGRSRFLSRRGVPDQRLAKWRTELQERRKEIKKAVMSRDNLPAVNEAGDALLAQCREIVKRVSAFEDFSSC